MSRQTDREKSEVLKLATDYFKGLYGLELIDHIPSCCAEFRNELGYVTVQVIESGIKNEIVITTKEWEYQVQDFIGRI